MDVSDCVNVLDNTTRLACYDEKARGNVKTQTPHQTTSQTASPSSTSETVSIQVTAKPTEKATTSQLPPKPTPRQQQAEFLVNATIVEAKKVMRGKWLLKLDNGQIWREVEPGRNRYKKGEKVKIESSFLGSYSLFAKNRRARKFRPVY